MTELKKENLAKHIAFLRNNANRIRSDFDMFRVMHPCGTPSCSLGWASVSIRPYKDNENNLEYILDVFGIDLTDDYKLSHYIFGSPWTEINNTPEAAAARMEALLYNQVPEDWEYEEKFSHPIVLIPSELEQANKLKAELTHTLK